MRRNCYRKLRYPLRNLEPGEYFEIPIEKLNSASVTAWKFGKAHGMRFSVHYAYDEEGNVLCRSDGEPRVEVERVE